MSQADAVRFGSALRRPGLALASEVFGQAPAPFRRLGYEDSTAFILRADGGDAAIFANLCRKKPTRSPATALVWQGIAIHLGAAMRLVGREMHPEAPDVDVVIDGGGRIAAAASNCGEPETIEQLRASIRDRDRARSRRGRADGIGAVELWTGILEGRWSLVDYFDSDGRRFILVRRNAPHFPTPQALSKLRRQVVFYAGLGFSLKEIAYSVGLPLSTIATHLRVALDHLDFANRAELVRVATTLATTGGKAEIPPACEELPQFIGARGDDFVAHLGRSAN